MVNQKIDQRKNHVESPVKMNRKELFEAVLEDMTLSEVKDVLSSLGQSFRKRSKREELVNIIRNHPDVTAEFLRRATRTESISMQTKTTSGRSNSQDSSYNLRRRSTSSSRQNPSVDSPKKKRTSAGNDNQKQVKSPQINSAVSEKPMANGHHITSNEPGTPSKASKKSEKRTAKKKGKSSEAEDTIAIWSHPFTTLFYFSLDCYEKSKDMLQYLWLHKLTVLIFLSLFSVFFSLDRMPGRHQAVFTVVKENFNLCFYWIFLGILSSVGLGTGLHTFLLYLGPHIASVTLAAFECNSVDFPSPPYPTEINCPDHVPEVPMTIWKILSKVRLEAFMWGLGTALGELPPYFMARAARLSGTQDLDAELVELEELRKLADARPDQVAFSVRCKIQVERLIEKVGFPGILLMASIPNPLFDLAGITCGYLLVPFWQFFGATAIGKAIVKMHIQKVFVIMSFSEHHAEHFVQLIGKIPYLGPKLQAPFQEFFANEKQKLHRKAGSAAFVAKQSWLSWVFDKLVLAMVLYFVVSIVNSMAQSCYKRRNEVKNKENYKKSK